MREITNHQPVEANHVYVIPRDTNLRIAAGILKLQPRERTRTPHRPIDAFFESLEHEDDQTPRHRAEAERRARARSGRVPRPSVAASRGPRRSLPDAAGSPLDLEGLSAEVIASVREQEREVLDKDGRWHSLRVHPYLTLDNQVDGAVLVDIDQIKRSQEALRQSEERLSLAVHGAGMATWDVDLTLGKALWSDTHFRIPGYDPVPGGEASLEMWQSRLHPDDRERVLRAVEQARSERSLYAPEHRIIRADNGEERWQSGGSGMTRPARRCAFSG